MAAGGAGGRWRNFPGLHWPAIAHKGGGGLIEAFARLQPSSRRPVLHIYGPHDRDPRYVAHLKRRAAGQADIRFEGVFPNREMLCVHAGLDVLVVPSLWYENSPTVILEAYAAGTPVIVSALGGMAELVQDGIRATVPAR